MTDDVQGVPASPSGSRPSDRAQEVAAVPASIPNAGEWAVFVESPNFYPFRHTVREIASVTPKLVRFVGSQWPRQVRCEQVAAALADQAVARKLCDALNGVAGEYNERERRARDEFNRRTEAARDAAEKTMARLVASATEAASAGETALAGSTEGESAAPEGGDAQ